MIVAVTGANGFIGTHICDGLRDAEIAARPVVRKDFASDDELAATLRGADVLVHAAGATRAVSESALRASNVDLTQRVVAIAGRCGVRRVVLLSSQAAAGPASSRDIPVTETDDPHPIEAYGRSKLAAEAIVRDAAMSHVILRPAAVYGPRDRDFLEVFRLANLGIAIHPANRDHWISIVHVRDVARTVIAAATGSVDRGTYFVANREPQRWRDLFVLAAAACGRTLRADVEIPGAIARAAALVGDAIGVVTGRPPLVSTGKLALSAPRVWLCSGAAAARDLGFSESADVAAGFRETCAWYRTNHWLGG